MVDSVIRQTRCAACETEHVFKGGHQPKPRKKEEPAGVLVHAPNGAGGSNGHAAPIEAVAVPALSAVRRDEPAQPAAAAQQPREAEADNRGNELWSGHRRLIRATLPKVEGTEPPPRAIPEFTMHQRNVRGAHAFRQGQPWHDRGGDGQRRGHHHHNGNNPNGNNGNGSIPDNIGDGSAPGSHRPGGRRRRRRGRKPGGPV